MKDTRAQDSTQESFRVTPHPIFARGTFARHPGLLERFVRHAADHLVRQYERGWQTLISYEDTLHWPLLTGPGVFAATHPGADTVFSDTMSGLDAFIYNSDCLYVNPVQRVFAVSDPPGITASSRLLFEKLDAALQHSTEVEGIVNRLNREMPQSESATLGLLHFPAARPGTAFSLVAGDTLLFRGNVLRRTLMPLPGTAPFLGTPYADFRAEERELAPGDFFVIASDGIAALKGNEVERRLEEALLAHLDGSMENFVLSAMRACNGHFEQHVLGRSMPRFGGCDNVSLLVVVPEELPRAHAGASFILGGDRQFPRRP